jgi:hypothetical protein
LKKNFAILQNSIIFAEVKHDVFYK